MRYFYRWVALLALLVLAVDELVKTVARVRLAPCPETASTLCDSLQVDSTGGVSATCATIRNFVDIEQHHYFWD